MWCVEQDVPLAFLPDPEHDVVRVIFEPLPGFSVEPLEVLLGAGELCSSATE